MSPPLRILFGSFSVAFMSIGVLMLFVPTRYPSLYAGFLRANVMKRESTDAGRCAAIRLQGLICFASGAFFALFLWAMWSFVRDFV